MAKNLSVSYVRRARAREMARIGNWVSSAPRGYGARQPGQGAGYLAELVLRPRQCREVGQEEGIGLLRQCFFVQRRRVEQREPVADGVDGAQQLRIASHDPCNAGPE